MGECLYCNAQGVETRIGCCWDCATHGEERAAKRTVLEHLIHALVMACKGNWLNARIDLCWAYERLTRTGDYAPDGYFDHQVPNWRRFK